MAITYNIISPEYTNRYIHLVNGESVNDALKKNTKAFRKLLKSIPSYKTDYAYATDKWTIKEVLQHVIDAERVFSYRALWFARKEASQLAGFDENTWAVKSHGSTREWDDLLDEFKALRRSTRLLFASFTDDEMNSSGMANGSSFTVAAIGYVCAGHVQHHLNILNERYL